MDAVLMKRKWLVVCLLCVAGVAMSVYSPRVTAETATSGTEDGSILLGLSDNGVLSEGGPIRDIVSTAVGYRPKTAGATETTFVVPTGITQARITAFATNSGGGQDIDENIQLVSVEVDLTTNRWFGQMMLTTGASTAEDMNFAWNDAPLNETILKGGATLIGNSHTQHNDLWVGVQNGNIAITQTQNTLDTTYLVEFLDADTSSLSSLGQDNAYFAPGDTNKSVSIPAGSDLVVATSQSGRLVNGTWREDPAAMSRLIINLDSNDASGYVGVSNGANASDSLAYSFTGYDVTNSVAGGVLSSGATLVGDTSADGLGTDSPNIYTSGGNLFVERVGNDFASQFGTLYTFEFYDRKSAGSPAIGLGAVSDYTVVRPVVDTIDLDFPVPASAKIGMLTMFQIDPNANNTINENKGIASIIIDVDNETSSGSFQFIRAQVPDLLSWGDAPLDGTVFMEHSNKVSSNALLDANNVQTARLELSADKGNLNFWSRSHSSNYFDNSGSQRNLNVVAQVQWFGYTPFIVDMADAPQGTTLSAGQPIGNDLYEIDPADIATLAVNPAPNFNGTFVVTSTFNLNSETKTVTVAEVQDNPDMWDIAHDNPTNPGNSIAEMMQSSETSPDAISGIALDGVSGNGSWEFSIDNGQSWSGVGSLSSTNALLLRPSDRLRYVPSAIETAGFTYHMWDEGAGVAGSHVDLAAGGNGKFADVDDSASIESWDFVDPNQYGLSLLLRFTRSGGIDHPLNVVGDTANGITVCPADPSAGCDFADDTGYNDNGTPLDAWDDYYTGDLKVRSNDTAEVVFYYTTPNSADDVYIESTLPQGLVWNFLPGYCLVDGSSLVGDGYEELSTLTCRVNTALRGLAGELPAYLTVLGTTSNGTVYEISAEYGDGITTKTSNSINLTTTSAPRFNLKYAMDGIEGRTIGQVDGRRLDFHFYLETWDNNGTTNPFYGNEQSVEDFTIDVTAVAPGAILVDCFNAASSNWSRFPFPGTDDTPFDLSFPNVGDIACTQNAVGEGVSVSLTGVDTSLRYAPIADRRGAPYASASERVAVDGVVRVFVPMTDILNAPNEQLSFTTCASQSGVVGLSAAANFITGTEDTSDNCVSHVMKVDAASFSTGYSGEVGTSMMAGSFPGTATGAWSGDGVVIPQETFAAEMVLQNDGSVDLTNIVMCDVFDTSVYNVKDITTGTASRFEATDGYTGGYAIEYATGYVAAQWPSLIVPDPEAVETECGDPSVVWYSSTDAVPGGDAAITKVRVRLLGVLPIAESAQLWTQLEAIDGGVPSGTILPLFGSAKGDGLWDDGWYPCFYEMGSYPGDHVTNGACGDRVMINYARVVIDTDTWQDDSAESVALNGEVGYVIIPEFTSYDDDFYSTVVVTTHVPADLSYQYGSATQGSSRRAAQSNEPLVVPNATEGGFDLVWDLGNLQANQQIDPIYFTTKGVPGLESGEEVDVTSLVHSPAAPAGTAPGSRNTRTVIGVVQQKLYLGMLTSNMFIQPSEQITFTSTIYNGRYEESLTGIDYISALPYVGDQREPATSFSGQITLASLAYDSSSYSIYYTADARGSIDLVAINAKNDLVSGATNWCLSNGDGSVNSSAVPSNGSGGSCPASMAEVNGFRIVDNEALGFSEGTRSRIVTIVYDTVGNQNGDIYTNRAAVMSDQFVQPAFSADYPAIVVETQLEGQLWFDLNGNGTQDNGETGIADVEFWLVEVGATPETNGGRNGRSGRDSSAANAIQTVTSDSDGNYRFSFPDGIDLGRYEIQLNPSSLPEALIQTFNVAQGTLGDGTNSGTPIDLTVPQQKSNIHFGFQGVGTVSGTLWHDADADGQREAGDDALANWPIEIKSSNGSFYQITTREDGSYQFDGLGSDSYTVTVVENTTLNSAVTADSDGNNDGVVALDVSAGVAETDVDFGLSLSNVPTAVTWLANGVGGSVDAVVLSLALMAISLTGLVAVRRRGDSSQRG